MRDTCTEEQLEAFNNDTAAIGDFVVWMRWELATSPIFAIGLDSEDCRSLTFTELIGIHQLKDVEFDILPR